MLIPKGFIQASKAEKEYGIYQGALRQDITRLRRIKASECVKVAGSWFVSRKAVERIYKDKKK